MTDKQLIGAEAPPAADALDGTEVLHVVQGANSRVTTTQNIADLASGGGSGYAYSGTYAPTITSSADAAASSIAFNSFGDPVFPGGLCVARYGSGVGTPSAGDTVTVSGAVHVGGGVNSEDLYIPLPFEPATVPHFVFGQGKSDLDTCDVRLRAMSIGTGLTVALVDANSGDGIFTFSLSYQTANAVDP